MKKIQLLLVCLFLISIVLNELKAQDLWQQLNGPFGGNVNKILSAPNGDLYAVSGSGVFKSSNEGLSWAQVTPSSIKDIVTGTVAPNGFVYICIGNFESKIYRSTDNGSTWTLRLPDGGYAFSDMVSTPGGTVLAGTSYKFSFHGQFIQSGEIHRSVDNGNSFTLTSFPDLAVNSMSANTNGDVYVATLNGLFRSQNGGASWGLLRNDTCSLVFTSVSGHVFLRSRLNVLRSTNNGASWDVIPKIPMASVSGGTLYTAEGGIIFKSTDNGNSWNQIAQLSSAPLFDVYSMLNIDAGRILAGSDLGVFRSINSGINWAQSNNGIRVPNINTVVSRGNNIFTGSERYISRSTDNGNTWVNLSSGLPEIGPRTLMVSPNGSIFAAMNSFGIFRSVNNGDSWTKLVNFPAGMNEGTIVFNSSSEVFTDGSNKIFKSVNNGDSWTEIISGLPNDVSLDIYGLSIDHQNNLYASASWGGFPLEFGLFRSTNSGANWIQISNNQVPGELKFNSQGDIFGILATRLLHSVNGGASFDFIPTAQEYAIDIEISNNDQIFLHYVENEVYGMKRSTNNAASWTEYSQGLGQLLAHDMEFDDNDRLLAGTQSGLFRTITATVGISQNSQIAEEYNLSQNYPNPFNPHTKIRFSIPSAEFVKLAVYNSIGEQVEVLVQQHMERGEYEYLWSGSGYASGVYFYKIETQSFTSVKKMMMIK